jgi:hypothetical protein
MIQKRLILLASLLACLVSASVRAEETNAATQAVVLGTDTNGIRRNPDAERVRRLGDDAPPLTVLGWAKGGPVKIQPGTNTYVLVFCSLSRANDFALTNLSDLQKRYADKGVITIAISDDNPQDLKQFVQQKADEIDFLVAADDLASRTARTYQHDFGQYQLPKAYVVGHDGKVLWFGHPLRDGLGEVVDQITSGQYNLAHAQKAVVASEEMNKYLALARDGDTNTVRAGRMLLSIRANDPNGLCDMAYQIATDPYIANRDAALANAALDRALEVGATNLTDIAVDRAILFFQTGKPEEGLAKARQALIDAQSQADKNEAETCVHAMEIRMAAPKNKPAGPGQP